MGVQGGVQGTSGAPHRWSRPSGPPVLQAAADEIIALRQQHDAIGKHVVPDLRRILGAIFPD
jgi:hypothetical protein